LRIDFVMLKELFAVIFLGAILLPLSVEAERTAAHSTYLICIGEAACSEATDQQCAVAMGRDVQLPNGHAGSHVLATPDGVSRLPRLDAITVTRIDGALRAYGREWSPDWKNPQLDPAYVEDWNAHCAEPTDD
jgi:hypothetical protein